MPKVWHRRQEIKEYLMDVRQMTTEQLAVLDGESWTDDTLDTMIRIMRVELLLAEDRLALARQLIEREWANEDR